MKSKVILSFICLLPMIPLLLAAERMTDNWRLTGYTKYRDALFADMARLNSPAPGITAVWIKIAPSKRSKYLLAINEYLRAVQKRDQVFKSIEILCEINCQSHLIRFTNFVYLDNDRNVIHKACEAKAQSFLINEGSIWYPVEKAICKEKQ